MEEEWKVIGDYENYEICRDTRVRNIKTGKILKPWLSYGYDTIELCKNGRRKSFRIHRLLAMAFIPNPENKPDVHHINGKKNDPRIKNLLWVTESENLHKSKTNINNNSGQKGIWFNKRRNNWEAYISIDGKKRESRRFINKEDAIKYRKELEMRLLGYKCEYMES